MDINWTMLDTEQQKYPNESTTLERLVMNYLVQGGGGGGEGGDGGVELALWDPNPNPQFS